MQYDLEVVVFFIGSYDSFCYEYLGEVLFLVDCLDEWEFIFLFFGVYFEEIGQDDYIVVLGFVWYFMEVFVEVCFSKGKVGESYCYFYVFFVAIFQVFELVGWLVVVQVWVVVEVECFFWFYVQIWIVFEYWISLGFYCQFCLMCVEVVGYVVFWLIGGVQIEQGWVFCYQAINEIFDYVVGVCQGSLYYVGVVVGYSDQFDFFVWFWFVFLDFVVLCYIGYLFDEV